MVANLFKSAPIFVPGKAEDLVNYIHFYGTDQNNFFLGCVLFFVRFISPISSKEGKINSNCMSIEVSEEQDIEQRFAMFHSVSTFIVDQSTFCSQPNISSYIHLLACVYVGQVNNCSFGVTFQEGLDLPPHGVSAASIFGKY